MSDTIVFANTCRTVKQTRYQDQQSAAKLTCIPVDGSPTRLPSLRNLSKFRDSFRRHKWSWRSSFPLVLRSRWYPGFQESIPRLESKATICGTSERFLPGRWSRPKCCRDFCWDVPHAVHPSRKRHPSNQRLCTPRQTCRSMGREWCMRYRTFPVYHTWCPAHIEMDKMPKL